MPEASPVSMRRGRQRRVFDMSTVRCRALLSNAPRMSSVRKLGLLDNELSPVEAALQDYIAMFHGPLPPDVIAALTTMFNIDDDAEIDHALAGLVDDGIAELQEGVVAADGSCGSSSERWSPAGGSLSNLFCQWDQRIYICYFYLQCCY